MNNPPLRLGIDVGGTNTDAVIMRGKEVLASTKRATTREVRDGVMAAVDAVLRAGAVDPSEIGRVMVGTTQFINAFVQRQNLERVAAIRVALPKSDGIPPMTGWPADLMAVVGRHGYLVRGGSYFDGREYAELDEQGLERAAVDIANKGIRSIALTADFSPVRPDIEQRAARIVSHFVPDADITLSSEVGGLGLVDRENAALINASLRTLSRAVVSSLLEAFARIGIEVPLFLSQNDGTLISADQATRFPILTCSAGPTNSIRGAAFLTGIQDAIVMDIGGTTTDLGFLVHGFPRETATAHLTGGVRTNFRMPDVLSIALGGGSLVRFAKERVSIGPESVGYELARRARVFGGDELTATDIVVRGTRADIGDHRLVQDVSPIQVQAAVAEIHAQLEAAIDRMKTNSRAVPVILVGGGHILVSQSLRGVLKIYRPEHAEVANAVGAAIALVSGRVDKMYDYLRLGRDAALREAKAQATEAAVAAGAHRESVDIVEVTEQPMKHVKTGAVHVKVRAVGPLAAGGI